MTRCDPANQYETRAPTISTDRTCATLTPICTAGSTYEHTSPSATSDRRCGRLTVCDATEYERSAGTVTTDRVCKVTTACVGSQQAESAAPTATTDRRCALAATAHTAAFAGHTDQLRELLSAGSILEADARDGNGHAPIHMALTPGPVLRPRGNGDPIDNRVDHRKDKDKAARGVACNDKLETVELLASFGADLNIPSTRNGRSPLHTAAVSGCGGAVVATLIAGGADPTLVDAAGQTALLLGIRHGVGAGDPSLSGGGFTATAAAVLAAETPNLHDRDGNGALHTAISSGAAPDIVAALVAGGYSVEFTVRDVLALFRPVLGRFELRRRACDHAERASATLTSE